MIRYQLPKRWLLYDNGLVMEALVAAKAAVQTLKTLPYQRSWVEKLQELQLKREVASKQSGSISIGHSRSMGVSSCARSS
jgi:hypothetical protein